MRLTLIPILFLGTSVSLWGGKLTCAKINNYLVQTPTAEVRSICYTAEARCLAQRYIDKLDPKEPIRQSVQERLAAQVEFELEVCEALLGSLNIKVE